MTPQKTKLTTPGRHDEAGTGCERWVSPRPEARTWTEETHDRIRPPKSIAALVECRCESDKRLTRAALRPLQVARCCTTWNTRQTIANSDTFRASGWRFFLPYRCQALTLFSSISACHVYHRTACRSMAICRGLKACELIFAFVQHSTSSPGSPMDVILATCCRAASRGYSFNL